MLRNEGIQIQVCKNDYVKCADMELSRRKIRDRLHNYFTYKNPYRYLDILPKFFKSYNDTLHSTTSIAPSRETDAYVPAICRSMEAKRRLVRFAVDTFRVGQHVRICK